MKKLLLGLVVAMQLVSCQIEERIEIKEDGSGMMTYDIDASALMQMAGDEIEQSMKSEMGEAAKDTVIDFGQLFAEMKNEIAGMPKEQQEMMKSLEHMKLSMRMDPESKEFKIKMLTDFKSVADLQDMMEVMQKAQALKAGGKEAAPSFGNSDFSRLHYTYDGKKFSRRITITDKEAFAKAKDSLGGMMAMFGSSGYTTKYTFPKRVKSVSNKNASYSDDRKTVTVPFTFTDYMSDPESMNFEVVFE